MRLINADALIENKFKNDISYNAFVSLVKRQPSAQPKLDEWCKDCKEYDQERHCCPRFNRVIRTAIDEAQPEPLTDKEQRIFLAAMGREEKVCEEVDRNYVREPYEDSLMRVCKEIRRKVKGALWT